MKKLAVFMKRLVLILIPILLVSLCFSIPQIIQQVKLNSLISKSTRSKLDYELIYKNYDQLENAGYTYSKHKGFYDACAYKDITVYSRRMDIEIRKLPSGFESENEEAESYNGHRLLLNKGLIEIDFQFGEIKSQKLKEGIKLAIEKEIDNIMAAVADQ